MRKCDVKHILSLSGGKDSAALAVYMRQKYPDLPLEYVFIDSGCELPETYQYLERIRAILNIDIKRIGGANKNDGKDFSWWLRQKNYYLPSAKNRWCTEVLKLLPYARWINEKYRGCTIHSYVGLRADEKNERKGFIDRAGSIESIHPFIDDNLVYEDVINILESSGVGLPDYYKWRTRSGCYFCFYQTKKEWIGLYENHKELFLEAAAMEKYDKETGKRFTWNEGQTLLELIEQKDKICTYSITNKEKDSSREGALLNLLDSICTDL